jgi:NDP-sugar pyrophosphorylase family protein
MSNFCTHAVILAGGKGTRLWPLTKDMPKPMVEVGGQPFLYWQLLYLKEQGISDVLLLISHLAEVIEEHFNKQPIPGLKIRYSREPSPMGTGGALKHSVKELPENFWLLNGDSFLFIDLGSMYKQHQALGCDGTLAVANPEVVPVPPNLKCAKGQVVEYRKEGGPEYTEVDAGVYVLSRKIIEAGPSGTFDIGALWPPVIERKKLGAFTVWDRFFDIGTPERLKTFEKHLKDYF